MTMQDFPRPTPPVSGAGSTRTLVRPMALRPGDTIAVVSPSAGFAGRFRHRTQRGIAALEQRGYRVRTMPHALRNDGWTSASIAERVRDLEAAFADPSVSAVLAAIGGNHSAQLLDSLDMSLIAENPKILCGYSDITSLLVGINVVTGLVTFYGPALLPQFGEYPAPLDATVKGFARCLGIDRPTGELAPMPEVVAEFIDWADDARRARKLTLTSGRHLLRGGRARGPLLVGCLPTLRHLIGTPWEPDPQGAVLVLDLPDLGYDLGEMDADLWHLRNAGYLRRAAAVLVGRLPRSVRAEDRRKVDSLVAGACAGLDLPVVTDVEVGHADPSFTLPQGLVAEVEDDRLSVTEAAVRCDS